MCPSLWTLVLLSGIVIGIYALVISEIDVFFFSPVLLLLLILSCLGFFMIFSIFIIILSFNTNIVLVLIVVWELV